ncbi:MAG TPA: protein kinase, partial [Thermoanaerobaculia bacterium]|nr:protein kinase [Thermoanaerobaculia bacterium]
MQLSPGKSPNAGLRGDPFPSGTMIARYRLDTLIGSGAMGDVYRAHDRVLDRDVALKVLPTELVNDRERVQRFAQEARAASALSHPHIVTVHEVGHARPASNVRPIAGGRKPRRTEVHYIAMEYVQGKTLREALPSLTLRRAIEVLEQVAEGLGKAHAAGIIHRDLKPENILVAHEGYAKIVDFGLAKLIDPTGGWDPIGADSPTLRALTQNGEMIGTPGYMSPEQVTGKPLDQRTDIFSFGCILHEAVARRRPFDAESFVDTLYKILHEPVPPIPNAPAELQRIVQKCLAKEREQRYHSIRDVALDLREWLGLHRDSQPVAMSTLASRPPVALRRWLVIAALVALVPIAGYLFLRDRAKHAAVVAAPVSAPQQSSVRRITSSGRAAQVAISPDARYLAYVTTEPDGTAVTLEQVETRSTLQIVAPMDAIYVALTFSRDGNYLYFVRYDSGPIGSLYRVPILGGKPERVVSDVDTRVTFSPAGDELAFVRDDYNRAVSMLVVASADGLSERVLATFRIANRIWSPSWSADGQRIVVAQRGKIVAIEYPGGAFRRIASGFHFDEVRNATWTPSGTLLVAASSADSEGRFRLWEINPETSEGHALTDALAEVVAPALSGDGRTIAALQVARRATLFTVDANGAQHALATSNGTASGIGRIAWLGNRLIYAAANDGSTDLWSLDLAHGETTQLTRERSWELQPVPSPDGAWIYYATSNAQNRSTIWRMRPDGSDRRSVTDGPRDASFAIAP